MRVIVAMSALLLLVWPMGGDTDLDVFGLLVLPETKFNGADEEFLEIVGQMVIALSFAKTPPIFSIVVRV